MQKIKKLLFVMSIYAIFVSPVSLLYASSPQVKQSGVEAFRYYEDVFPSVSQPTVVEVPFDQGAFILPVFAVLNIDTSLFEPYLFSVNSIETGSRIETSNGSSNSALMQDNNFGTYVEFPLTSDINTVSMTFTYDKPVTSSTLTFSLDNYVALPQKVSISSVNTSGTESVVLAPVQPIQGTVAFPKTTSKVWRVSFDYVQPLRISEIKFNEDAQGKVTKSGLRFLAHPGQRYKIYFDADRYTQVSTGESGNLSLTEGVVTIDVPRSVLNHDYVAVDSDQDTIPDLTDNCVSVSNSDQKDTDRNGRGDACEDYDRDSIVNSADNCPETPNHAQEDTDADSIGNVCDNLDNRPTERMPWLPWVGIGVAGLVIVGLFLVTLRHKKIEGVN